MVSTAAEIIEAKTVFSDTENSSWKAFFFFLSEQQALTGKAKGGSSNWIQHLRLIDWLKSQNQIVLLWGYWEGFSLYIQN